MLIVGLKTIQKIIIVRKIMKNITLLFLISTASLLAPPKAPTTGKPRGYQRTRHTRLIQDTMRRQIPALSRVLRQVAQEDQSPREYIEPSTMFQGHLVQGKRGLLKALLAINNN